MWRSGQAVFLENEPLLDMVFKYNHEREGAEPGRRSCGRLTASLVTKNHV